MPKLATTATTTVETTTTVKLSPALKQKLMKRLKAFQENHALIKAKTAENDAIKSDIDTLFADAGESNALINGTKINGFGVKMVFGTTKKLDKIALMKTHGLSEADFEAHTDEKPSKPYVRIDVPEVG